MNRDEENELQKAYEHFMAISTNQEPVDDIGNLVDSKIMGYGTTLDEQIHHIEEFRNLILNQEEQSKVAGLEVSFDRKRIYHRISINEDIAIFVEQIGITLQSKEFVNQFNMRASSIMEKQKEGWKLIHFHSSVPVDTENDTWNLNEFKKENEKLQKEVEKRTVDLKEALINLKASQTQLIHSEKMASLGELTAGIAHEIQNPLNFVNNFGEVSAELIDEMSEEIKNGDFEEVEAIAKDLQSNLQKIIHHGKRADAIVKGMLQHSRANSGQEEPTDINALCDEYLRLSYHGLRAKDKSFNATLKMDFDPTVDNIHVVPQDMGRVILNLLTNAFYTVNEKKQKGISSYEPTVSISTRDLADSIEIMVSDNGNGMPKEVADKIFQPFFTTKPTGKGTGLGLSMSYDIVTKGHGGEIKVKTKVGEGTDFIIQIPKQKT